MTLDDIHNSFRDFVKEFVEIPVAFENEAVTGELNSTYGDFILGDIETTRLSQGKCGTIEYSGNATLRIVSASYVGASTVLQQADKILKAVLSNSLYKGLKFIETPSTSESVQEYDRYYIEVMIPYTSEGNLNG